MQPELWFCCFSQILTTNLRGIFHAISWAECRLPGWVIYPVLLVWPWNGCCIPVHGLFSFQLIKRPDWYSMFPHRALGSTYMPNSFFYLKIWHSILKCFHISTLYMDIKFEYHISLLKIHIWGSLGNHYSYLSFVSESTLRTPWHTITILKPVYNPNVKMFIIFRTCT